MPNITNIPSSRVEIIDSRTGLVSREWYRFFLNLFQLTGGGTTDITLEDLQLVPVPTDASSQVDELRTELGVGPPTIPPQSFTNYSAQPSVIVLGPSPYTYINNTGYPADVIVSGGGVSLLEFSRNGVTFFSTGSFYGMFTLSPYDQLRVTYLTPPNMTLIPR
ncbi:hypothetical protein K0U83_00305 [bacterium]|nr:hypothetical protein [bacterium]